MKPGWRDVRGADLAIALAQCGTAGPSLDMAAEIRRRTGMFFDNATSTWRGTNGAAVTTGMVQSALKAVKR